MNQSVVKPVEEAVERQALTVNKIEIETLRTVLQLGIEDFRVMPTHAVFLAIFYAIVGLILVSFSADYDLMPLVYPLIAGFTLLGPFAALGMYELSRRRERGEDTARWHMFEVWKSPARNQIIILGLILLALFFVWLEVAFAVYSNTIGLVLEPGESFLGALFGTSAGWAMIIIGNALGALFAALVFTVSVISFPLLLDRHVPVSTAVATSIAAVVRNPQAMFVWGAIVAISLAVGSVPFFLGLAIVMPVLGHATWHLYRAVVE